MTRAKAAEFFGRDERTIQRWVNLYGVKKRTNRDGRTEYLVEDLDWAFLRGRHRGKGLTAH